MKRKLSFLLVLVMIFTTLGGSIAAIAEDLPGSDLLDVDFSADGKITVDSSLGTVNAKEYDKMGNAANNPTKGVGSQTVKVGDKIYVVNGAKSLADTGLIEIDTSSYKAALISEMADGFSVEAGFVIPSGVDTSRERYVFGGTSGGGFGLRIAKTTGELEFIMHNGSGYNPASLGAVSANEYHHVVATYDKTAQTVSVYLDGTLKATKTGVTKFSAGSWNGKVMLFDTSSTSASYQYSLPKDTIVTDFHMYADPLTAEESAAKYTDALKAMTPCVGDDILDLDFTSDGKVEVVSYSMGLPVITQYSNRNTPLASGTNVTSKIITAGDKRYIANGYSAATANSYLDAATNAYVGSILPELQDGFSIETGFVIPSGIDTTRDRYIVGAACGGGLGIKIAKTTGKLEFVIHQGSAYKIVSVDRPADDVYHHVVASYDKANSKMTLYVDGVLAGTTESVTTVNKGSWNGSFNLCDSPTGGTYNYTMPQNTFVTDLHVYSNALTDEQSKAAYTAAINAFTPYENKSVVDVDFSSDGNITVNSTLGTVTAKEYEKAGGTANNPTKGVGTQIVKIGDKYYSVNGAISLANTGLIEIDTSAYKTALISEMANGFSVETGFVVPSGVDTSRERYIFGGTSGGGFGLRINKSGELEFIMHNGSGYNPASLGAVSANEYHHAVANYDKSAQTVTVYLDGTLKATKTGVTQFSNGTWNGKVMLFDTSSTSATYQYSLPQGTVVTDFHMYADPLTASESTAKYSDALKAMTPYDKKDILELKFTDGNVEVVQSELGDVTVKEYSNRDTALTDFPSVSEQILKVNGEKYTADVFKSSSDSSFLKTNTGDYASKLMSELQDGFSIETGFVIPSGIDTSRDRYIVGAANGGGMGIRIAKTTGNLEFAIRQGTSYKTVSVARPEDGVYHHVVANYNANTDTMTLYVDGVLAGTTEGVTSVTQGSWNGNYELGDSPASITSYTYALPKNSIITGLHIYSDALTDAQSKAAYTAAIDAMTPYVKVYDDDFEPVVRFMVTSDAHIGSSTDPTVRAPKLASAITTAYDLAENAGNHYEDLDAVAVVGDLINMGTREEIEVAKGVFDANVKSGTEILTVTGNHEYNTDPAAALKNYTDILGDDSTYFCKKINGYWFIGISSSETGWGYTGADLQFLHTSLETADADDPTGSKPIFVFHHVSNRDTVVGSDAKNVLPAGGVITIDPILKQYPQVIDFSGHSHKPINDEYSIYQKDYTALSTGTLYQSIMATYQNEYLSTVRGDVFSPSQVYLVEVDADGNTRIRIFDIYTGEFVGETYTVKAFTSTDDFQYTPEKRDALRESTGIFFDADDKIDIIKTTSNLIAFKFDPVSPDSFSARAYKIVVEDKDGKEVNSKYIGWTYYDEDYETKLSDAISGLEPETDYTLKIYGENSGYVEGLTSENEYLSEKPLTVSFTTPAKSTGTPVADLMDISIGTDTLTDISGNDVTVTVGSDIEYGHDDIIGMDYVSFSGKPGSTASVKDFVNDKTDISYGYTMEAYFKIDDFSNCSEYFRAPLAMEQSGGFGFDIYEDKTCTFQTYCTGYKTVTKTLDEGKYYHWVCTYDGDYLVCYINGHEMSKVEAPAPTTFTADAAMQMILGGDTTVSGGTERFADCSIAIARLYSQPVTAEQADELWQAVKALQDPALYPDDSDDPEYLNWVAIDDTETEYVTIFDTQGNIHDHAKDQNGYDIDYMYNGESSYFLGQHLYKGSAHVINRDVRAKLSFIGTAFRYIVCFRGPAADGYDDAADVYIDGEYYTTVTGLNGPNDTSRHTMLEVTDLPDKAHEITFVSHGGNRIFIDAFQVVLGEGADEKGEDIPDAPVFEGYVGDKASKVEKAPVMDGKVSEEEWGEPIILADPYFTESEYRFGKNAVSGYNSKQNVKVYATNDKDFIYLAMTMDNCEFDNTVDPDNLWKSAHFGFGIAQYDDDSVVPSVDYLGKMHEQYTAFWLGLDEHGNQVSKTATHGLDAWDLPDDYYAVTYDEATKTYSYEVKIPYNKTNINLNNSLDMALSISAGAPSIGADEIGNRYYITEGFSLADELAPTDECACDTGFKDGGALKIRLNDYSKKINTYVGDTANAVTKPVVMDGVISEEEWGGGAVVVTTPGHAAENWDFWAFDPSSVNSDMVAKLYLASDEDYLYIGGTLDECDLDNSCTDKAELYKSAHFGFSLSGYDDELTYKHIPFEGNEYEQYTAFIMGLVNGKPTTLALTQGHAAWELPAEDFAIKYDENTRTYTYECRIPFNKTNVDSSKIGFSAYFGAPYTGGDAANRILITTGAALAGGAGNWAHKNNALIINLSVNPNTGDSMVLFAVIAMITLSASAAFILIRRRVKENR